MITHIDVVYGDRACAHAVNEFRQQVHALAAAAKAMGKHCVTLLYAIGNNCPVNGSFSNLLDLHCVDGVDFRVVAHANGQNHMTTEDSLLVRCADEWTVAPTRLAFTLTQQGDEYLWVFTSCSTADVLYSTLVFEITAPVVDEF